MHLKKKPTKTVSEHNQVRNVVLSKKLCDFLPTITSLCTSPF